MVHSRDLGLLKGMYGLWNHWPGSLLYRFKVQTLSIRFGMVCLEETSGGGGI